MNTQNLPEPKSISLNNGVAIVLPNGDVSVIQKNNKSVFLELADIASIGLAIGRNTAERFQSEKKPTHKVREESQMIGNSEMCNALDSAGKRHTAAFLRNCRVIVMQDPLFEYSPFQNDVIPEIVLHFGKKEGHGEINPDMEYESYLDGKTFKLRNIVNICP